MTSIKSNSAALFLLGVAAAGFTALPTAALAQSESGGADETTAAQEERLQDTPISESAMSAEELARRDVTDLSSLGGTVPGLFIGGANLISIRGISGLAAAGASQASATGNLG
jgi:iron complex outermembrane recepter protein